MPIGDMAMEFCLCLELLVPMEVATPDSPMLILMFDPVLPLAIQSMGIWTILICALVRLQILYLMYAEWGKYKFEGGCWA